LTAAIFVFAFAVSVQSQEAGEYPVAGADNLYQLNACQDCKCPMKNVPCPQTTVIQGAQGSTTTQISETCPFDYDDNYGYVETSGTGMGADRNCRVIFEVCSCPQSCETKVGTKIGVQMTILTTGVYWAKDAKTWDDANGWNTVRFGLGGVNQQCATNVQDRDFGEIKYYQTVEERVNSKGKFVRIPRNEGTPADGCLTSIPAVNKVKVLESVLKPDIKDGEEGYDYLIKKEDSAIEKCKFWIDIPAMRLDGTAKQGDAIQVRITLLWDRVPEFCEDCQPPILCECIRTVGVVCCDQPVVNTEKGCVFFPYVFQGQDSWQSGVAVSALNRTALPDNAKCTLTVQDTAGNTATYVKTDMGNKLVWAFVLDQIIGNFTGGANLVPGAVSLKIESNYRMDGYSFMMAEMDGSYFGAGAMARGCTCSTCP
jgi:hypothetical protein